MISKPLEAKQFCFSCGSSRCVLFGADLHVLTDAGFNIQRVHVDTGETIFHQEAPVLGWFILCHGRAKLVVRTGGERNFFSGFVAQANFSQA